MAIFRHASGWWMSDENADRSQLLVDSAADLLAISPRICGMTAAEARSVGGLAEPAGEVVVQVLLIVADPGDVAVGA
jgi:hypothetical protein